MTTPAPLLNIRDLSVYFPTPRGEVCAVRDVSFAVHAGEVLGMVGESGSGKSVTSLAVMRLLPPQARITGKIIYAGCDLGQASDANMRHLRGACIAMIFQEPMTALNPVMRVGDQIAEAVLAHPESRNESDGSAAVKGTRRETASRLAIQALHDVNIPNPEQRVRDYPHQLSGGMRQRVMIAMAIVNRPHLLIADEPTTALDVTIQAQILELLAELRAKFGLAMLFISHDLAVVSQVAHRIAVMYAGTIVEIGSRHDIFGAPVHPYTRGLLQAIPTLTTERDRPLRTIEGTVPPVSALPPGCAFEPRCELRRADCSRSMPPLLEVSTGHYARCPVAVPSR